MANCSTRTPKNLAAAKCPNSWTITMMPSTTATAARLVRKLYIKEWAVSSY
jgi:hypothetical protein